MATMLFTGCTEDPDLPQNGETNILSLVFNGNMNAVIDTDNATATVSQPEGTDVSSMKISTLVLSDRATANVKAGDILDLSDDKVITVTNGTAKQDWTVSVTFTEPETPTEPSEPTDPVEPEVPAVGFVCILQEGELQGEALAAWTWAKNNVENIRFINLWDVNADADNFDGLDVVWCHYDFTDWPGIIWDTKDKLRTFWEKGGAMFLTRDGARYINDVYEVTLNKVSPNNIFGAEADDPGFDVGEGNGGFACMSYTHEIYNGIETSGDHNIIYLKSQGCHCSNRTLQWGVDWDPYGSLDGWKSTTGATPLASNQDADINRVTIAEFAPRTKLEGFTTGKVITIGTPYFEFMYNESNTYRENIYKLASNAINYLAK